MAGWIMVGVMYLAGAAMAIIALDQDEPEPEQTVEEVCAACHGGD
jgi:hypothetical protein